jgi:cytochrome c551/c552
MNLHLRNTLPNAIRCLVATATLFVAGHACAADELELAVKQGCIACHLSAEASVGPSFTDVAKKSGGLKNAAETLAEHIVKGTGPDGLGWMKEGKASLPFMSPNRNVEPDDALRLAHWILATKGEMPGLARYVSERFSVSGSVKNSLDVGVDDLRKSAKDVREIAVVTEAQAGTGKTENLKGVPLRTLLEKAVIVAPDRDMRKVIILGRSASGQFAIFSWCELFNSPIGEGVLVYFEKDGKALGDDEGRIALVSSKDNYLAGRHVRWLKGIEVRGVVD